MWRMKRYICLLMLAALFSQYVIAENLNSDIEQYSESYAVTQNNYDQEFNELMTMVMHGQYTEALPKLLVLRGFLEDSENLNESDYCAVVLGLFSCYNTLGDIASNKQLILDALKAYESHGCNVNSDYTRQLWLCLGQIEGQLKNYDQALHSFHILQIMFEEDNDFGESYLVLLLNIGSIYLSQKDYLSAKLYIDEALDSFERINGYTIFETKNTAHVMLLNQYGMLCYAIKELDKAESCFNKIIEVVASSGAPREISANAYYLAYNNLASIYMQQGRWQEAKKIFQNLNSGNNEVDLMIIQNLLLCELFSGNKKNTIKALLECNNIAKANAQKAFSKLSEAERDNYWSELSWIQIVANNFVANYAGDDEMKKVAYNNLLLYSNLMLSSFKVIENYVTTHSDAGLTKKYSEYQRLRTMFSYKEISTLEREKISRRIYDIEHDIYNSIPELSLLLLNKTKTWTDVKELLDDNEIAIEFTYIPVMIEWPKITRYYGAFVVKNNYEAPKFIVLDVDISVDSFLINDNPDPLFIGKLYAKEQMKVLYQMLWSKIEPYTKGCDKVYYSPAGYLPNLNFDLLRDNDDVELGDKFSLIRVSSTANISRVKESAANKHKTSCVYGNIAYDETTADMAIESAKYQAFSGEDVAKTLASRSINDRGRWGSLPFTKNEIDSISSTLSIGNVLVQKLEGREGSEEAFKSYDGKSPDIIHLATHGFVIDTQAKAEGNKFVESTMPFSQREGYLMWCGLMMAGSNNAWTGNFNLENVEDGILTADEISRLDLSNTKLVVLSACETARGKVDPVEGVLGLQRAFKKAGVQTIVMSLWKVPDESTAILMTQFYKGLMAGTECHQALKDAMNYVKSLYPDPYYWAGFIMLD